MPMLKVKDDGRQCWMPTLNVNVKCRMSMLDVNVEYQYWMPMLNADVEWHLNVIVDVSAQCQC